MTSRQSQRGSSCDASRSEGKRSVGLSLSKRYAEQHIQDDVGKVGEHEGRSVLLEERKCWNELLDSLRRRGKAGRRREVSGLNLLQFL